MRSRGRRFLFIVLLLVVAIVAWEPARVTVQTLVLLPYLLDVGPKPLNIFSGTPNVTTLPYRDAAGGDDEAAQGDLADLWLPSGASADNRVGAMLLVFGVNNLGREHPAVQRVADGLARTGVAVRVPDSATLLAGRLEVGEVDGVVRAFDLLSRRPEVDPERVGIVGFSVGGSLSLIAAADERIADRVRYVNAFGAYADVRSYLASVAAHAYERDGEEVPWEPTPLALEVFTRFVFEIVPDEEDRQVLADAYEAQLLAGERPLPDSELERRLSEPARAVYTLLTAESLRDARVAVDELPAPVRAFMAAISPVEHLDGVRADVYLMHEVDDHHVPYVQSRVLAGPLEARELLVRHAEFRLFDHVQPDDLDLIAAAPELWKLLWHVQALMVETL